MLLDLAYLVKINDVQDGKEPGDIVYACLQDKLTKFKSDSENYSLLLIDNVVTRNAYSALRLGDPFSEWRVVISEFDDCERELFTCNRRLYLSVSRFCDVVKNKINHKNLSVGDLM